MDSVDDWSGVCWYDRQLGRLDSLRHGILR